MLDDGTEISGTSENVEFGGLLLSSDQTIPIETKCTITIKLSDELKIEAKGEITRITDDEIIVIFSALRERDLDHLDALIRYNSTDDDELV